MATSMIDISDGLSTDLSHICAESRVGAKVWASALPLATVAGRKVDLELALQRLRPVAALSQVIRLQHEARLPHRDRAPHTAPPKHH